MEKLSTTALVRLDGTLITERDIRRGMRVNIIAGSLSMVWAATTLGIPLVMIMQSIGASGVLIGAVSTIQQLAMGVQIPASYLSERFPARKTIWGIMAILHRVLWIIPALLPFLIPHNWPLMARLIVGVVAVSSVIGQAASPLWFSWMADLIPQHLSARFWSRRQSIVMAAYLVAMIAIGYILDAFPDARKPGGSLLGFSIVLAVGTILGTLDIVIHLFVPEPKPAPVSPGDPLWRRILAPWRVADFRWLSLSMGAWTFGLGLVGSFGIVYLRREFHFTYMQLTVISVAGSIGAILAGFQSGYVIDRLGARTYAAVLFLTGPLMGIVWFFLQNTMMEFSLPGVGSFSVSQPLVLQLVASVAAGAMFSIIGLCQYRLLSALSPREGRTMAMAGHWTVIGATAALGPLLGGLIMDWFDKHPVNWVMPTGTAFGFFHVLVLLQMAVSWFLAAPLMLAVSRSRGDLPIGEALPRLWLGNPLRAVRNVYNIYAITAAVSASERERAVRHPGLRRVRLAVSDLIANLDDPAYDVREAAVAALGKMSNAEAVEALVARLDAPGGDLALPIVRTLGRHRHPAAVDALLRQFAETDREIQFEAARGLGLLGDHRAVEPLLDRVRHTTDDKVFLACAEALGRLGEPRVVGLVLHRAGDSQNPLLRQSLLLIVGDVLGEPNEFYKILIKAREDAAGALDRLLMTLRQQNALTEEETGKLRQMFEAGDTAGCARSIADLGTRRQLEPAAMAVLAWLRHRPRPPDPAEILLALYLLGRPAVR